LGKHEKILRNTKGNPRFGFPAFGVRISGLLRRPPHLEEFVKRLKRGGTEDENEND
jgi:hypothetical protein